MVRPGRDGLSGWVEVDETYLGGLEEGAAGRRHIDKALIVIAAEADGRASAELFFPRSRWRRRDSWWLSPGSTPGTGDLREG